MDLRELPVLNGLKNLESILFHNNVEDSNPFCRIRMQYLRALSKLKCINNLTVDGMTVEEIVDEERGKTQRRSDEDLDPEILQIYQNIHQQKPNLEEIRQKELEEAALKQKSMPVYKVNSAQPPQPQQNFMHTNPNSMNNTAYMNQMMPQFDQLASKYEDLKMDMVKVQTMLKNSEEEKFKLEAKMESTEKYWINKVKGLEENYRTLLDKLESSRKDVESAEKNLTVLNEENKRVSFKNGLGQWFTAVSSLFRPIIVIYCCFLDITSKN